MYGAGKRAPFREDDEDLAPISPYAETKLEAEQLCRTYSRLHALNVVCVRLFTVYGPRQRPDLAIHRFTDLIVHDRPIPVFGDGSTSRDYTYVDDAVYGIVAALRHDSRFDIFNLGTCRPIRLDELIRTIESTLGKEAEIHRLSHQAGDVPSTWADISKATKLLAYHPTTSLKVGVRRFVDWYHSATGAGPLPSASGSVA